ncbi:MAG: sugar ABC transporter permease [Clostridia bacterium]
MNKQKGRKRFAYLCVMPAIILFTIFMIIPTFNIFRMSLYKWGGYSATKTFVGFENFRILFSRDAKFLQSMQNTILLIVIVTLITIAFALIFAALLSREKVHGSNFFRVVFYIPNILSVVVISAIFSALYNTQYGTLNSLLNLFTGGGEPIYWLGNQKLVMYSIAIAMIWQAIGYYMVMYMSSMAAIPESLYESAKLDGSGRIHQFFHITLPLIWTNIRTTLTFFIISTINLSFQFVKAMTNGGPDGASNVFLFYMYDQAYTNSSYGYGMAIGVVIFLFSFALSAIVSVITKREPVEM